MVTPIDMSKVKAEKINHVDFGRFNCSGEYIYSKPSKPH